jgi:predicted RNA-binding protein with PUA-like domain
MKSETELISYIEQRLIDWADWGRRIEAYAKEFGTVTSADVASMDEEKIWRLWKCSGFAETGTFDVPKPTSEEGWQQLRDVTSILADRSKSVGERFTSARNQCKKFFGSQNAPSPAILRALLILEGAQYGTVATRNYSNMLLAWANRPLLDYSDAKSITGALESIRELGNEWSDKLGLKSIGDRARVPWHLCEAVKNGEEAGDVDSVTKGKESVSPPTAANPSADLNLIYCGPPGTGKTYGALHETRQLLLLQNIGTKEAALYGEAVKKNDKEQLKALAKLLEGGNEKEEKGYWWVVANPKEWEWETLFKKGSEDFRYGRLQRNYEDVQPGDIVFGYCATPRKQIEVIARMTEGGAESFTVEPVQKLAKPVTWAEIKNNPVLKKSEPVKFGSQGTLFKLTPVEAAELQAMLIARGNQLKVMAKPERRFLRFVTFHQSYGYEDFVEGLRPVTDADGEIRYEVRDGVFKEICGEAKQDREHIYALIIDEINRGNIAKIFGELITLLESDKRLDALHELRTILPVSGEEFVVPPNVVVVGTMNTSDRSIALLDVALRRRFRFVEVMPDPSLLADQEVEGIALDQLLTKLNEKIEGLIDRDHQIGHSYFLAVNDRQALHRVWRSKIMPLLQEYFYGDGERLQAVLGSGFVESKEIDCGGDRRKVFRLKSTEANEGFVAALKTLIQS